MAQASGVPDRLRPIDERILRLLAADGIQVRLDIERRLALSNCVTASAVAPSPSVTSCETRTGVVTRSPSGENSACGRSADGSVSPGALDPAVHSSSHSSASRPYLY
ncbi:hypothetical protein [Haladaptatus sp. R4]|uniref:hypothetical protein n=1 Tax=Haladaptatus sp. R4 TaxID=1679489 RepID=UPI000B00A08E|nr:hypothetical protein [Haladaptatus sp. R4]